MIFKRFSAAPYSGRVNVIISKSLYKAASKLDDTYDYVFTDKSFKDDDAVTFDHTGKDGGLVVSIIFRPNAKPPVIAHECLHALNIIYAYNGARHSLTNDEPTCYYLGSIVDKVYRAIKLFEKKFG